MTASAVAELPTKAQFGQQVNKTFHAASPGGLEVEMSLAEFRDIFDSESQETFSLLFKGPVDMEPEQGTYIVSNSEMGEQAIFLVPVERDAAGVYFEAVYNRFKG